MGDVGLDDRIGVVGRSLVDARAVCAAKRVMSALGTAENVLKHVSSAPSAYP